MERSVFTEDHELYRESVRQFVAREVVPHRARWEEAGIVDRSLFEAAGEAGFLGVAAFAVFFAASARVVGAVSSVPAVAASTDTGASVGVRGSSDAAGKSLLMPQL